MPGILRRLSDIHSELFSKRKGYYNIKHNTAYNTKIICNDLQRHLHIIKMKEVIYVVVTNTYVSKNKKDYEQKRDLIHRRCILILRSKLRGE